MEDHEHHVCVVLKKLRKVGLYAKLEKCEFHQFEMEFLGYSIFGDGIRMDLHKVQTIVDWATLTFVQDVQCFFDFANFYQRFITHYVSIVAPLTRLTRKDNFFFGGVDTDNIFQSLKDYFTTTPLLIHVDLSKPFVLEMDISNFIIGVVFSQLGENNHFHPFGFPSLKFSIVKTNYDIHDK